MPGIQTHRLVGEVGGGPRAVTSCQASAGPALKLASLNWEREARAPAASQGACWDGSLHGRAVLQHASPSPLWALVHVGERVRAGLLTDS